jgi:hypothetical protein
MAPRSLLEDKLDDIGDAPEKRVPDGQTDIVDGRPDLVQGRDELEHFVFRRAHSLSS